MPDLCFNFIAKVNEIGETTYRLDKNLFDKGRGEIMGGGVHFHTQKKLFPSQLVIDGKSFVLVI